MSRSEPIQGEAPGWRALARSVRSGRGTLPTTLAGAEVALLIGFVGLRLTDAVQLVVSLPTGLQRSSAPTIDLAFATLWFVESIAIVAALIRARRYVSRAWMVLDLAIAVAVIIGQLFFTAPGERVGTWTAWGYSVSVSVCAALGAGIAAKRRREVLVAAAILAGAYLLVSLSPAAGHGEAGTAWSNALSYFGFALFPRALASFVRRLGREADAAREAALRAGRALERDQQRRLLHDHEGLMRLLANGDLDPAVAELVRSQAVSGANRVRSFLTHGGYDEEAAQRSEMGLPELVRRSAAGFADLPLELVTDLARDVTVDGLAAEAVGDALDTLLHNVRRHARAQAVVIHADAQGEGWELTVRDDGVGFDPSQTSFGFGLAEQVVHHLDRYAIKVRVDSAPGEGTTVTLLGPMSKDSHG